MSTYINHATSTKFYLCHGKRGTFRLVTKIGNVHSDRLYTSIQHIDGSMFQVKASNNKFGIINIYGETLIKPIFEDEFHFLSGMSVVNFEGKYGVIDKTLKYVIPTTFEEIDNLKVPLNRFKVMLKHEFEGEEYITFEVAKMQKPDDFDRTHTAYVTTREEVVEEETAEN